MTMPAMPADNHPFDSLSYRQKLFVESYVASGNASAAYRQAGYSGDNMAVITAGASEILAHPKVAAAVSQRTAERLERFGFEADRVILELACIGFADIRDLLTVTNGAVQIKDSAEWTDNAAAAVASVTVTEFKGKTTTSLKLHNKNDALDKLAKRLNMYREHQEATGTGLAAAAYAALLEYDRTKQQQQQHLPAPAVAPAAPYIIEAAATATAAPMPPPPMQLPVLPGIPIQPEADSDSEAERVDTSEK